jgi:NADPH:quinone reductase
MTIPASMIAIGIPVPGGPEALVPERRPVPAVKAGEILIKVAAAGVNRPDAMQRSGKYPPPPGAPDVPGLEIAGVVVALGEDVTRWSVGDRVCALVAGGGYATFCTAHESLALPVPGDLSMIEAAAVPETAFTVWTNVFDSGALKAGEWLLVHGGSSGIGTMAIQLAKAFGAKVIATAGTDEKCKDCLSLGADAAVNYRTTDFVAVAKTVTDGHGADVILDMVGGDYLMRNLEAAAKKARLVQIATQKGAKTEIDLRLVMQKRLMLTGSTLRPRSVAEKAAISEALKAHVWPLLSTRKVTPQIHATFPLEKAAEAHAMLEASTHTGKIMLVMDEYSG